MKYYSYPNDDAETATFDRAVLLAMLHYLLLVVRGSAAAEDPGKR